MRIPELGGLVSGNRRFSDLQYLLSLYLYLYLYLYFSVEQWNSGTEVV
jgi:hypothetical protein